MNYLTDNTRIIDRQKVPAPYELVNKHPINDEISKLVYGTRNEISQILHNKDDRLLVVSGPCSIHDTESALEYASWLKTQSDKYKSIRILLYNRPSQILSIEIYHTISKLFSMRISLQICYLVSLPDFVKFRMSSFYYLLRGKVQRLSSPFNDLGNVFQQYVNLVGVPNFKMNVQVMPSLSKPINGLLVSEWV